MKNRKIYNFIISGMIVLIGVIYSLSLGYTTAKSDDNSLIIDEEQEEIVQEETPPSSDYNLGENASAYERLEYAIKLYTNGAGFTSIYTQTCTVMGNTQNIYLKRYRGGGYDITEEYYKMYGMFSAFGRNEFKTYYSDGNTVLERIQKGNFNFENKTYTIDKGTKINSFTVNEWENVQKKIKINGFFTTLNASTTSVISYDGKARGKDYYTLKLAIDKNKLDEQVIEIFKQSSDSYNIKSMTITFKISKATGGIMSYEREDFFDGTTMGFTGSCEMRTKEIFQTMNKSALDSIKTIALNNFDVKI